MTGAPAAAEAANAAIDDEGTMGAPIGIGGEAATCPGCICMAAAALPATAEADEAGVCGQYFGIFALLSSREISSGG